MQNDKPVFVETSIGTLGGSFLNCEIDSAPIVIIHPGSGPTDLNGNNPTGLNANSYRHLANQLAKIGISTLRIDKRGMFSSANPGVNPNDVTLDVYAEDLAQWVDFLHARQPDVPLYVLGHSEGGLVAINQAQGEPPIAGVILVATPGRTLEAVLKEQLQNQPYGQLVGTQIDQVFDFFKHWRPVDTSDLHSSLQALFAPAVQNFWMSLANFNPATEIAKVNLPCLIAQGDADIQVTLEDAGLLHDATKRSTIAILPHVNHVLKTVANPHDISSYGDPTTEVAPALIEAIESFIKGN